MMVIFNGGVSKDGTPFNFVKINEKIINIFTKIEKIAIMIKNIN